MNSKTHYLTLYMPVTIKREVVLARNKREYDLAMKYLIENPTLEQARAEGIVRAKRYPESQWEIVFDKDFLLAYGVSQGEAWRNAIAYAHELAAAYHSQHKSD